MIKIAARITKRLKPDKLTKRKQLALVTVILTAFLITTQMVSFEERGKMVLGLSVLTLFLSAWALRGNLKGGKWLILLVLPPLFSGAVGLFYFLLPVRWLTRLPSASLFALGMYALLLTENIYGVATERTIGLLRVAQSVGSLITLITYFLLLETILSFHFSSLFNFILVFIFSFVLTVQSLWSIRLGKEIRKEIFYSLVVALCLAEMAFIFSFWPVRVTLEALFLTTTFYVLVGVTQQYLARRLFKKGMTEFLTLLLAIFVFLLLTTSWR